MAVSLSKYGLTVPSETTQFRNLGKELREMGISIENVLEDFDYNGADPNLVLSRVAALEADTGWITLSPNSPYVQGNPVLAYRKIGRQVFLTGNIYAPSAEILASNTIASLPGAFRPNRSIYTVQRGYGTTTWTVTITGAGNIIGENFTGPTAGSNWLAIEAQWPV